MQWLTLVYHKYILSSASLLHSTGVSCTYIVIQASVATKLLQSQDSRPEGRGKMHVTKLNSSALGNKSRYYQVGVGTPLNRGAVRAGYN